MAHRIAWIILALCLTTVSHAMELRIVTEEFPPYDFTDENGNVAGLATDVVRAVMEELEIDVPIEVYPWARAYKAARNEPGTMLYSVVRTEEREPLFHWVGVVCEVRSYLFKLRSRHDIKATGLANLKQYHIGVVRDWAGQKYLEKNDFAHLELVPDSNLNIKKLVSGRVDLIEDYEANLIFRMKKLELNTNLIEKVHFNAEVSGQLYAVLNVDTPEPLVDSVKGAFERVHRDGRYDAIRERWLGQKKR